MKRTPVLIDVNGVPLRESLSYNGGGAGFGGQMAEWLPPSQSADAALLPALRLGNARADDLVRNNGIAANAVAAPLKQAFDENVDRIRRERLPGELASALKQQLRIAIKR